MKYEGYTEFETPKQKYEHDIEIDNFENAGDMSAFYVWNSLNWTNEEVYCGWKTVPGKRGYDTLSTIWETRWWHSIQPKPQKYVGGPYRAAIADYTLGLYSMFYVQKFVPITNFKITYDKPVKIGETIETLITDTRIHDGIMKQECIQRVYGTDTIVGGAWSTHIVGKRDDFKEKQQDLTELNGDGNRDRGRYGEDGR